MVNISTSDTLTTVHAVRYQLTIDLLSGLGNLATGDGNPLFELPFDVRMKTTDGDMHMPTPLAAHVKGDQVVLQSQNPTPMCSTQQLILHCFEGYFTVQYRVTVADRRQLIPTTIHYFRDPELGLRIHHVKAGFSVPDRSDCEIQYYDVFPSVSLQGLASPALLNIALQFHHGVVGMGLLDYPNSVRFGLVSPFAGGDEFMGVLVDALGGNITLDANDTYTGPELAITFPEDKWTSITTFRQVCTDHKQIVHTGLDDKPDWWKRPTYCTYGDQIMHLQPALYSDRYWSSPEYTRQWVMDMVSLAERRLGWNEFTVIVDAFWQKPWNPDPVSDAERFPDMRGLVDWLHDRGHKVLLWYAPLACSQDTSCGTIAARHGLKTNYTGFLGCRYFDFSSHTAKAYLEEIAHTFFSSDSDCLDADGLKMDFLMGVAPPEEGCTYEQPDNGMGIRASRRFLELFSQEARRVKSDVLLNYSASDPRVGHLFGMNRLHDTKVSPLERERRARVSALANPHLLIDSDGAVMMSDWVEHTYISAAIYSTPCLYYVDRFGDDQRLPAKTMNAIGRLCEVCSRRQWGIPQFVDYGSWRSVRPDGSVVAESYDGKMCWLLTANGTAEAICLTDQPQRKLCLHGRRIVSVAPEPEHLEINDDGVSADWSTGQVYTIYMG